MALPTYPTTPAPRTPYPVSLAFKTIVNEMEDGGEERIKRWTSEKERRHLEYRCNATDFATLRNFFIARGGRYGAFTFTCSVTGVAYTMRFDSDVPPTAQKVEDGATGPIYEFAVDLVETNA